GRGVVTDGPFAETKEHLLGFYVVDCATREAAIEAARDLKEANPSAVYEVRPMVLYMPGNAFPQADAGLAHVRPNREPA
ncbi:YciI family protein, partial [Phenylobacterium sp.]|uniref:YciI family protein n=1 Tax=Phenylobacterium sp. TaxID=1871053 RepID=UPI002ED9128D